MRPSRPSIAIHDDKHQEAQDLSDLVKKFHGTRLVKICNIRPREITMFLVEHQLNTAILHVAAAPRLVCTRATLAFVPRYCAVTPGSTSAWIRVFTLLRAASAIIILVYLILLYSKLPVSIVLYTIKCVLFHLAT